jgi:hypothetical protein
MHDISHARSSAFSRRAVKCLSPSNKLLVVRNDLIAEIVSLSRADQAISRHGMGGTVDGTSMRAHTHVPVRQHYFVRRGVVVDVQHNGVAGPRPILDDGANLWCGHTEALHTYAIELKTRKRVKGFRLPLAKPR